MSRGHVYFFTFSTYGTRLPGRKQGSYHWDSSYIPPNARLYVCMRKSLKEQVVILTDTERAIIHDSFIATADLFGWEIDALNVREEHVHIVIFTSGGESAAELVRKLKTGATQALYRSGSRKVGARIWTKSYGNTLIWDFGFWRRKVAYTLNEQGDNVYLRQSQFGKEWIARIHAACGKKQFTMKDLYGGETSASIRAAFFQGDAE